MPERLLISVNNVSSRNMFGSHVGTAVKRQTRRTKHQIDLWIWKRRCRDDAEAASWYRRVVSVPAVPFADGDRCFCDCWASWECERLCDIGYSGPNAAAEDAVAPYASSALGVWRAAYRTRRSGGPTPGVPLQNTQPQSNALVFTYIFVLSSIEPLLLIAL